MDMRRRYTCIILITVCLAVSGCKKKDTSVSPGHGEATFSQDDINIARDAITRNMGKVAFGDLRETHIGKTCVVTARTMDDITQLGPPPPPPGMVRLMGQTTIYRGELDAVSPEGLIVRAAYPTAGTYKKLKIAIEDIQSIHLPQ